MTHFILIMQPDRSMRRVAEMSGSEIRDRYSLTTRAQLAVGDEVQLPDGRIAVDLLCFYEAAIRRKAQAS